ncbi:MAG: FAD-dependent oxidoreductase [Terriglobia bacterium]
MVGCEFACLLAQQGVRVTVIELLEDVLWNLDADIRRELRRHMEKTQGVRIFTGATLEEISADDQRVRGQVQQEWVKADLLLAALGRHAVTQELQAENTGLTTNERGFIDVDEYGRTQVATVYTIGDVTGGPLLAHAATSQGLVAAENACGRYLRNNEKYVPDWFFTSPEIGTVGLSEQEAQQQNKKVKTGKFMLGALGKALAVGEPMGFVKWVADAGADLLHSWERRPSALTPQSSSPRPLSHFAPN